MIPILTELRRMRCKKCGEDIGEKSSFCNFCGEKQNEKSEKNKGMNELASEWIAEKNKKKEKADREAADIKQQDKKNYIMLVVIIAIIAVVVLFYSLDKGISTTDGITSNSSETVANSNDFLPYDPILLCKTFDGSNIINDTKGWAEVSGMGFGCGTPYKIYPLLPSDNPAQNEDDIAFYVMADDGDGGRFGRYATIMLNVNKKSHEKLRRADFLRTVNYFYDKALGIKLDDKTKKTLKTFQEGFTQSVTVDGRELMVIFKRTPYINNNGVEFTMRLYPIGVEIPPVHQIANMKK
ncbi:TPA: zinc ribbon domain-containing protein [Yersinia enterocolitica]|uniref:hypothetical protein n=2 Tax=Yersinia enterocolitica TaxID=630 RepID=UPI0021E93458|nr:hypothetical protein [Yersinia enterocolitica]UYK12686.1 hypothetical protein N4224_12025 [Yersinia enterocolitica]HDL7928980.1 zinc ribbon domain-containing protein [Yersinia enterocolitica]HEN3466669.1 zinc ribbon domain-containing protein [Yersinia enterocolitica]